MNKRCWGRGRSPSCWGRAMRDGIPPCNHGGSPCWVGEATGEPHKAAAGARLPHLHTDRSEAFVPKHLVFPWPFLSATTSRVSERVCFPGRTLLGLLIFGNAAVLSESKCTTRFKGQPQPCFFPALLSSQLFIDAPPHP